MTEDTRFCFFFFFSSSCTLICQTRRSQAPPAVMKTSFFMFVRFLSLNVLDGVSVVDLQEVMPDSASPPHLADPTPKCSLLPKTRVTVMTWAAAIDETTPSPGWNYFHSPALVFVLVLIQSQMKCLFFKSVNVFPSLSFPCPFLAACLFGF